MSFSWLFLHASGLIWAHYGVSGKIGRFMDRRHSIPLGAINLAEFVMLGEEQPERTSDPFIYAVVGRAPKAMPQYLHAQLGLMVKRALLELSDKSWPFPKTNKRSVARARLRRHFDQLRCKMHALASQEHGDDAAWAWYYGGVQ